MRIKRLTQSELARLISEERFGKRSPTNLREEIADLRAQIRALHERKELPHVKLTQSEELDCTGME